MDNVLNNRIQVVRYLFYFVTKSFLISVLFFIVFITLLFFVYFIDLMFHNNNPLFGAYVIVSPSMVPTIQINDAIVIHREDNDNYQVGDIITFSSSDIRYKGLTITHRIVDKATDFNGINSRYKTKGDNNPIADAAVVKTNDIYGKVLFKIPKIGYLQSFFEKPINFFLCLLIPGMMFVGYEAIRIIGLFFFGKLKSVS